MAGTSLTYGTHTIQVLSVNMPTWVRKFTSFNFSAEIKISEESYSSLLSAGWVNPVAETIKENEKLQLSLNGQTWLDLDPASKTIFNTRAELTVKKVGAGSAEINLRVTGNMPSQHSDGHYPFEVFIQKTQSNRVIARIKAYYFATSAGGGATAYDNFEDPDTGAVARAKNYLNSMFTDYTWDEAGFHVSEPDESRDWLEYECNLIERLVDNDSEKFDLSKLIFVQSRPPIGRTLDVGSIVPTTLGKNIAGEFEEPPDGSVNYTLIGTIPVKKDQVATEEAMTLYETELLSAITLLIDQYFATKAQDAGQTSNLYFPENGFSYDATDSVIHVNLPITVPATGGIISYYQKLKYKIDPGITIEYYLKEEDDYEAWDGKVAKEITCIQEATIKSLLVSELPPPPPLPLFTGVAEIATGLTWVPVGSADVDIEEIQHMRATAAGANVKIYTIQYFQMWKLIKKVTSG